MTSTTGSSTLSRGVVRTAAVVTHGRTGAVGPELDRLRAVAADSGVELVFGSEEATKHGVAETPGDVDVDVVIVLGGDGTMLRALARYLGSGVPVIGANYGRVGFLSSIRPEELEAGLTRVFAGEYDVVELATVEVDVGGQRFVAVNDAVVHSATVGRMVELEWAVGGEELGSQPCDGVIVSTPSGSTAYNLSNGGPVLVWGIDALAVTFVAPHSLHARPLVVPRDREVTIVNRTPDVPVAVLVDGHAVVTEGSDAMVSMRLGPDRSLLATLPEVTFVRRYRESFAT